MLVRLPIFRAAYASLTENVTLREKRIPHTYEVVSLFSTNCSVPSV